MCSSLVDKDRVKSGLYAIRNFGCDTLLLDDGLQFLRLKERIDIVLVDSESPFANRYLLPRGLLREPPEQLRRAHIIFITKCDGRDLSELRAELRRYNRHAEFVECAHKPLHLEEVFTHEIVPLDFLKDLRVGMISGIARPESFEQGLRKLGVELIYSRRFADHHRFSENEIARMFERSKARGARAVITTEKGLGALPAARQTSPAHLFPARRNRDHPRPRCVPALRRAHVPVRPGQPRPAARGLPGTRLKPPCPALNLPRERGASRFSGVDFPPPAALSATCCASLPAWPRTGMPSPFTARNGRRARIHSRTSAPSLPPIPKPTRAP